jgi:hypothetical protein
VSERTKDISDGYHTFGELYEHRHALFLTLLEVNRQLNNAAGGFEAWWTRRHHPNNDPMFDLEGMPGILVGFELSTGSVQYHMPARFIPALEHIAFEILHGPYYDGTASPENAVKAMMDFAGVQR